MLRLARLLSAVTPRRLLAFLLLAVFARQILSAASWLGSVAWALIGASAVRACLLASANLAFEATLIYLALRGLGAILERRHRARLPASGEPTVHDQMPPASPEEVGGVEGRVPDWPGGGGDDDRVSDRR